MQVVAPHLEDRTAVDVARRIAHVVGGYERPPALAARSLVWQISAVRLAA